MIRPLRALLVAFGVLGFVMVPAHADPADCANALRRYNSAISDLSVAIRSYTACLSSSRGHDDCSLEFSSLQAAQSDFEDAVRAYGLDCS